MVRQEEAETGEDAGEAAGEETSSKVLAIGDCELRSLLIKEKLVKLSGINCIWMAWTPRYSLMVSGIQKNSLQLWNQN